MGAINVKSRYLADVENEAVFVALGRGCHTLATTVAELYYSADQKRETLDRKYSGVVCFVKDNPKRSYFIRFFDRKNQKMELVCEHDVRTAKRDVFRGVFSRSDSCSSLTIHDRKLIFLEKDEAEHFQKEIEKMMSRLKERRSRRQDSTNTIDVRSAPSAGDAETYVQHKHKSNKPKGKLTKDEIGKPTHFKHVSGIRWDPDDQLDVNKLDPVICALLKHIGIEDTIDIETLDFIYDFIDNHGGVKAVADDLDRRKGESETKQRDKKLREMPPPDRNQGVHPPPSPGRNQCFPPPQLPPGRNQGVPSPPSPDRNQGVHPPLRPGRNQGVHPHPPPPGRNQGVPPPLPDRNQGVHPPIPPSRNQGVHPPPLPDRNQGVHPPPPPLGWNQDVHPPPPPGRNQGVHPPPPPPGRNQDVHHPTPPDRNQGVHPLPPPCRNQGVPPPPPPGSNQDVHPPLPPGRNQGVHPPSPTETGPSQMNQKVTPPPTRTRYQDVPPSDRTKEPSSSTSHDTGGAEAYQDNPLKQQIMQLLLRDPAEITDFIYRIVDKRGGTDFIKDNFTELNKKTDSCDEVYDDTNSGDTDNQVSDRTSNYIQALGTMSSADKVSGRSSAGSVPGVTRRVSRDFELSSDVFDGDDDEWDEWNDVTDQD